MTARCEWFTGVDGRRCTGLGYVQAAGHWHCQEHYREHRAEFPDDPPACDGSLQDYHRHRKNGEAACAASRYAQSAHESEKNARNYRKHRAAPAPRQLQPCGTPAAYRRHQKAGETPCAPCVEANRARQRKKAA
ncbi:MAG: hypothetical protein ACXV5Q_00830 [Frankiaceae bacterium]